MVVHAVVRAGVDVVVMIAVTAMMVLVLMLLHIFKFAMSDVVINDGLITMLRIGTCCWCHHDSVCHGHHGSQRKQSQPKTVCFP